MNKPSTNNIQQTPPTTTPIVSSLLPSAANSKVENSPSTQQHQVSSSEKNTKSNINSNIIKNSQNNTNKQHTNSDQNNSTQPMKTIKIIGDSMLLGIDEKKVRDNNLIRIRPHSGAKSYDMVDLVKVSVRRKPDAIVIHVGSNDFNNPKEKINTVEHMEEVFRHVIKESPKTQLAYSLTFNRYDKKKNSAETNRRIKQTNEQMKVLCRRYGAKIVDNSNMARSLLDYNKGWHPTNEGKDQFVDNWYTFIDTL